MATVAFTRLWLNPVADPSAGVGFRLATLTSTPQKPGDTRQYGTRLRGVSTGVKAQQVTVSLRCDSRDEIDFLETYQGEPVWVRDPRGRKFAAIYLDPQIPEQASPDVPVTVPLTLNEVTVSEVV